MDVGGAFIHGTGVPTSDAPPTHHVDAHDFGTSVSSGRATNKNGLWRIMSLVNKTARIPTTTSPFENRKGFTLTTLAKNDHTKITTEKSMAIRVTIFTSAGSTMESEALI